MSITANIRIAALTIVLFITSIANVQSQLPPQPQEHNKESPNEYQRASKNQGNTNSQETTPIPFPSIFNFFTPSGLHKISTYCAGQPESEPDKWLQKFICDIRATDTLIALFSGLLVIVTFGLIFVGFQQQRIMRASMQRQLRAYVASEPQGGYQVQPGKHIIIYFLMKNYGHTPAYNVMKSAVVQILPYPLPDNHQFPTLPPLNGSKFILHPGQQVEGIGATVHPVTIAEINQVLSRNDVRIYVFGLIQYTDAFEKLRKTQFCSSISASGGIAAAASNLPPGQQIEWVFAHCKKYNKAD